MSTRAAFESQPSTNPAEWKFLDKTGFASSGIDAAFAIRDSPGHEGQVYFFSGENYLRLRFTPGTPDEELLNGPTKITLGWASLDKAGFRTVDAIMPITGVREAEGEAYVFSGDQYVRTKVNPGVHGGDEIVFGPAKIKDEWPSLVKAGNGFVDGNGGPGHATSISSPYVDILGMLEHTTGQESSGERANRGNAEDSEGWYNLLVSGDTGFDGFDGGEAHFAEPLWNCLS
ncbi:hypothetical protein V8F20_011610 [Naviculisporaceae sp. PSN 640]